MTDQDHDNGILAQVPGEHIAQASKTLPPATTATEEQMTVETDVPTLGRVRIRYHRFTYRHGRSRFTVWVAKHAELAHA